MKTWSAILLFSFFCMGCQQQVEPEALAKLNGYWEIEQVVFPDGNKKDYTISETVDYFEIKGNAGFRKKVMPQIDGKYLENGHAEQIKIATLNDKTFIDYTTEYAKWKEEIVEISDSILVLKNDRNLEYHYKKPIPFTLK